MKYRTVSLSTFIDKLREKQFELRCEKAMKSIQSYNRQEFLNRIKDYYNSFLIDEKKHFLRFFDIVYGIKLDPPCIPNSTINLIDKQNISICNQVHIKSLGYFIKKLMENDGVKLIKNINNPDFINTLTYSLFPAISTNFHINLLPKRKGETVNKDNDYINYQLHNYNNIFTFLSEEITKVSNDTVKSTYQNAFDMLMMPMFSSPLFINFCKSFFQPIFSNLQNQEADKEKYKSFSIQNFLTLQFKIHFDHFTHLVPPFIALNIKLSDDPIRTIVKSFFEIALETSESAQFYGLFHFSRPPSESLLTNLKEFLVNDQSSSNPILKLFVDRLISIGETIKKQMEESSDKIQKGQVNVLTCACPEATVFKEIDDHYKAVTDNESRVPLALQMKNYYIEENMFINQNKSLFRKVLLSSKDIEVLQYIYDEIEDIESLKEFQFSNTENNSYFWVLFGFYENGADDIEEDDDDLQILDVSQTMRNNNDTIIPNLRHILQHSDPIPHFIELPQEMTVESFFDEYLVNKGPLSTLAKRKSDKKAIFSTCINKKKQISMILTALDSTSLEQTEEIEKLTIATNTYKRIDGIISIIDSINSNIEIINNLVYLNSQENKVYMDKLIKGLNLNYIDDPTQLLNDFNENYDNIKKFLHVDKPQLILMKMIDHEEIKSQFLGFKLTSEIVDKPIFIDFKGLNPFAESVDNNFSLVLNTSIKKVIDVFFAKCFPTKDVSRSTSNKNLYLIEKISNLRQYRNEILMKCREAFIDLSIFRKIDLFNQAVCEVKMWIYENLPNYISPDQIGEDEWSHIIVGTIFYANPPYIASTVLLLIKLFYPFDDSCFGSVENLMIIKTGYALIELRDTINADDDLRNLYQGVYKDLVKICNDINDYVKEVF